MVESSRKVTSSSESSRMASDELFIARKAIEKLVKPYVKDSERELKADMQRRYEQDGTSKRSLRFGGVEVGSVMARKKKPTIEVAFGHESEFLAYLEKKGLTEAKPVDGWESRFSYDNGVVVDGDTGEVCDFLEISPPGITWAVTGCEPEDVLPLISIDNQIKGMLEERR